MALLATSALAAPPAPPEKPASPLETLSDAELFEKVFKKKTEQKTVVLRLPIYYEASDRPMGDAQTRIAPNGEVELEATPIRNTLQRVLDPSAYQGHVLKGTNVVEKDPLPDGEWLPLSAFQDRPYRVEYDQGKLEIRIHVPPENRRLATTSLSAGSGEPEEKPTATPSFFSSYLNVNANASYSQGPEAYIQGRQPLEMLLENGTNVGGFVLESSVNYRETSTPEINSWSRNDVRLVADTPEYRLRETLGDFTTPVSGFQQPLGLGGIGASSQFGLQPSKLTVPTGSFEFFLTQPSRVEVFNNGRVVADYQLPAGRHDLRDLRFTSGLNKVQLKITNAVGQVEIRELDYYYASELLGQGTHQVSYSLGFPWKQAGFGRTYDTRRPTGSLYHRLGVAKTLTLGANAQVDFERRLLGVDSTLSTPVGIFKLEAAQSTNAWERTGSAQRLRYYYSPRIAGGGLSRSYSVAFVHYTPDFGFLTRDTAPRDSLYEVTFNHDRKLSAHTSLGIGLNYNINRPESRLSRENFKLSLGLSTSWQSGLFGNLSFQQTHAGAGNNQTLISFAVSVPIPGERQTVSASYNASNDSYAASWSYRAPNQDADTSSTRARFAKDSGKRRFTAHHDYSTNRAVLSLDGSSTWGTESKNSTTTVGAQLGSALMFAGGKFGVGRPVVDSFAIIAPEKNLKGETVEIDPRKNGTYRATSDWLGPAVVSDLASYSPTSLQIGSQKFRTGLVLNGPDRYNLVPTYKTGYAIKLGTDAGLSLSFTLLGEDGKPIETQPGVITALGDSTVAPVEFFTSRSGKTRADGFKPGRYHVSLYEGTWEDFELEIPEATEIIHNAGRIQLKAKRAK